MIPNGEYRTIDTATVLWRALPPLIDSDHMMIDTRRDRTRKRGVVDDSSFPSYEQCITPNESLVFKQASLSLGTE